MRKFALLVAAALLAGCAAQVVSTSPRSVVVKARGSEYAEAQKLADAECHKVGRFAQMIARPGYNNSEFVFDCVQ